MAKMFGNVITSSSKTIVGLVFGIIPKYAIEITYGK
jgi:hypothetical protein